MNMVDNFIASVARQPAAATNQPPKSADGQSSFQDLLQQSRDAVRQPVQGDQPSPDKGTVEQPEGETMQPEVSLYYQQMLAAQVVPMVQTAPENAQLAAPIPAMEPAIAPVQTVQPVQTQPLQQPLEPPVQTVQPQHLQTQTGAPAQMEHPAFAEQVAQTQTAVSLQNEQPDQRELLVREHTTEAEAVAKSPEAKIMAPERGESPQRGETKLDDGSSPQTQTKTDSKTDVVATGQEITLFPTAERTTTIKVGETPVLDTTATDFDAQVAKQVGRALEQGSQRVEIKLTPEALGEVTVELTRSGDGSLQVTISAATERGATLMEKHMSGLENILASTTRVPVQVEVQRPAESQQPQNQQQQQSHEQEHQGSRGGQEQQQRESRQQSEDFLQQLRLGLTTLDGTAS